MALTNTDRPRRLSMIRSFALADFVTIGNGFAGTGAILALMQFMVTGHRSALWVAFALFPKACASSTAPVARSARAGSTGRSIPRHPSPSRCDRTPVQRTHSVLSSSCSRIAISCTCTIRPAANVQRTRARVQLRMHPSRATVRARGAASRGRRMELGLDYSCCGNEADSYR